MGCGDPNATAAAWGRLSLNQSMKAALFFFLGGWVACVISASNFFGLTCSGWNGLYCLFGAGLILLFTQSAASVQFFRYARSATPGTVGRQLAIGLGAISALVALGLLGIAGAIFFR